MASNAINIVLIVGGVGVVTVICSKALKLGEQMASDYAKRQAHIREAQKRYQESNPDQPKSSGIEFFYQYGKKILGIDDEEVTTS